MSAENETINENPSSLETEGPARSSETVAADGSACSSGPTATEGPTWNPSESTEMPVSCPNCGQETSFEIWTVLNAQDNPEKAASLAAGTLTDFTCPHCGFRTILDHPCMFIDPDHKLMVYNVCGDPEMTQQAEETFAALPSIDEVMNSAEFRMVDSMQELSDKAAIFAAGYDDRIIEMLKLSVLGYAQHQNRIAEDTPCMVSFIESNDERITFHIQTETEGFASSMSAESYEVFTKALESFDKDSLAQITKVGAGRSAYVVDLEWAYYVLDAISD